MAQEECESKIVCLNAELNVPVDVEQWLYRCSCCASTRFYVLPDDDLVCQRCGVIQDVFDCTGCPHNEIEFLDGDGTHWCTKCGAQVWPEFDPESILAHYGGDA